jgi:hypothetical protein
MPEAGGPPVVTTLTVPVAPAVAKEKGKRDPRQLYAAAMEKRQSDPSQAALALKQAAELGEPRAMLELGKMYVTGDGVSPKPDEAGRWFQKASEAGNASAMVLLGGLYSEGKGVGKNDRQAVVWFRRAAEAGDKRGMDNLGDMYLNGRGVEKDPVEALRWHKKAADAGSATAMYHLGMMYEQGTSVSKNLGEAKRLYHDAALLGNMDARARLPVVQSKLETEPGQASRADVTEARSLTITGMQPPFIVERRMQQYTVFGSGLSLRSTIRLDVPGFVGSRQDKMANYRPAEAASDGTWMKVFIYIDRQAPGKAVRLSAQNPGSREAYLEVPVRR